MGTKTLTTEQNKFIIKMIEFYDKWEDSEFKVYTGDDTKRILGKEISRWLSVMIDITEYSEVEQKIFNSLREIYIIHQ